MNFSLSQIGATIHDTRHNLLKHRVEIHETLANLASMNPSKHFLIMTILPEMQSFRLIYHKHKIYIISDNKFCK